MSTVKWLRGLAAAVAMFAMAAPACAQDRTQTQIQTGVADNQRAFEAGARAMLAGDLAGAAAIFEPLAERTNAPRVRLELARCLYLLGDYSRSRREFLKVYQSRGLPYPVRRTINVFLQQIDDHIGYVRPQLSLAWDDNPTRAARSGLYEVLGAPLQYVNPNNGHALGAAWRLEAVKPLRFGSAWALAVSADGVAYDRDDASYSQGSIGLRHADFAHRLNVVGGWKGAHNASLQSQGPYAELSRLLISRPDRQTQLSLSLEWRDFAQADDLDEAVVTVSVSQARDLGHRWTGRMGVGGEVGSSANSVLPQRTAWLQTGASVALPKFNKTLSFSLSEAVSGFGRRDVFFGDIRHDAVTRAEVGLYSGEPVFGLFPGVLAAWSHRHSNLAFFDYDQAGVSLDFRRRF